MAPLARAAAALSRHHHRFSSSALKHCEESRKLHMHCCTYYETHTLDSQVSNRMPPGGSGARKCTAREFGINEESQIVIFGWKFLVEEPSKKKSKSWVYLRWYILM